MLSELLWCLKLKKIWWDLIKLASLAFGLKFEIVDKLKFWYGIRYVYPFENNLSSFLLKTFRCKCAKVYLYFEEVRKREFLKSCT